MNKLSKVFITVVFLISGSFIFINIANAQEIPNLLNLLQIPGRVEDTGKNFEINNSRYLNLQLDSSESIKLKIESIPEMITMIIEPLASLTVDSTQITLSGFNPLTKYFKYEDDYHNLTEFITDENGRYTYTQDLSEPHFVFIQPRKSTKFIKDDATGGDCYLIGNWNMVAKTCALTTDVYETIQIDSDGIILDGNGHTITGSNTGSGVYLEGRTNVTLKNLRITQFSYGIYLWYSSNNVVAESIISNNDQAIQFYRSNNNTVSNNVVDDTANNNSWGIALYYCDNSALTNNTVIMDSSQGVAIWIGGSINVLTNNTVSNNGFGIMIEGEYNTLTGNIASSNNYYGIRIGGQHNTLVSNMMTGNQYNFGAERDQNIDLTNLVDGKPIYYVKNVVNQTYDASTNAGTFYFINCDNVTVKDITLTKNGTGVYFYNTQNSRIENVSVVGNGIGISLTNSSNNVLVNNSASNNFTGILLYISPNNILINNTISLSSGYSTSFGISLNQSSDSTIENNILSNNVTGIQLYQSYNSTVKNNSISHSSLGMSFASTANDTFINNTVFDCGTGLSFALSYGIRLYNNNFINNSTQVGSTNPGGNIFNFEKPTGGNYWFNFDEPAEGCNDLNNDNFCDSPYVFFGGQDNLPWIKQDGWKNQPPTISGLGQFKSDGITPIIENSTTTENTLIFKAILSDPDNDQAKLQVELKEKDQDFNGQDLLESNFVSSGSEAVITRTELFERNYKWRARAMDDKGNKSEWQEFGIAGNVDFEVKLVPLYTQVRSPYPSESATDDWDHLLYADGRGNLGPAEERCGLSIAQCGCAISSMAMLGRYYKIDTGIDNSSVDPANINSWLTLNAGYKNNGNVYWGKTIEYLGFVDTTTSKKMARFDFNEKTDWNVSSTSARINEEFLNFAKPIVAYSEKFGHYFIIDGLLKNTYTLKDSRWYNTRKLDDAENLNNEVRGYNNFFNTANLFAYLQTPKKITASMHIAIASPAELLVTDPQGRKLGKDPIANITYNEIPDSVYGEEGFIITSDIPLGPSQIHKIKEIHIPTPIDGYYDIQVIGTDSGTYALNILAYDQNGNSKDIIQEGNIILNAIQEFELNYSTTIAEQTELLRIVDIDIKPGSDPNSINCKNLKGEIPVAILATEIFDAATVDADTVRFGPNAAQEIHKDKNGKAKWHIEDVDKDGDLDLVFHFKFGDTGIQCDDQTATLTGKTKEGFDITGSDSIRIVQEGNRQNIFTRFLNKLLANIYEALFR